MSVYQDQHRASFMFADIAGYTVMLDEDVEQTLQVPEKNTFRITISLSHQITK